MSSYYYGPVPELPWTVSEEETSRYRKIKLWVTVLTLIGAIALPFLPVPEADRSKEVVIPPRLAKLILERKKQPPPPKVVKKKEADKPKEQEKPKKKEPPKPDTQKARKKAASSGLLAFSKELAALRDDSMVKNITSRQDLKTSGKASQKNTRSIITARADSTSGGIDTSNLSRDTGGASLSGRSTTQVQSSLNTDAGGQINRSGSGRASRPIEEIRLVFDRNKSSIYSIYNRALRKDPTLAGKIVLELTISPSGQVTACRVISSEIKDDSLVRKLVARIKLFNFGQKNVEQAKVTYPIEFFPS